MSMGSNPDNSLIFFFFKGPGHSGYVMVHLSARFLYLFMYPKVSEPGDYKHVYRIFCVIDKTQNCQS